MSQPLAPDVDSGCRTYYMVAAECFRRRDGFLDSGCGNHRRMGELPESGSESRQVNAWSRRMGASFRQMGE